VNGFFGVGPLELLVIAVLALIFIGPQRLPGVIAQVMRTFRELREQAEHIQAELTAELAPLREELEGVSQEVGRFAEDVSRGANEMAAATERATSLTPPIPDMLAPPRASADGAAVPAPSPNGVGREEEDARPTFGDYRPS
jgi:sec-independent protein translocase protein TatB